VRYGGQPNRSEKIPANRRIGVGAPRVPDREFSDEVQQEEIGLCESVQRGLRSATYDRGRYSVRRENGVHHFHTLLSEFLERA